MSRGRERSKITRQDFIVRFGAGAVSGVGIIGALQGPTTRAKRAKQSNNLFLMSYQYRGFDYVWRRTTITKIGAPRLEIPKSASEAGRLNNLFKIIQERPGFAVS